jgi:soluble lytic murein transglycosylase-like protein
LAWAESSFHVRALNRNSNSIDRGLFQLNSRTFPYLGEEQFYNPWINAEYGLAHFRYCLETGKSEVVALAMYNAGISGVRRGTPYSTLHYVAKILDKEESLFESFEKMLSDSGEVAEVLDNLAS